MQDQPKISGRGGGKSDAGGVSYIRQPDTISSQATARMTLVLAAGPIEGLAAGAASIRFDGVPLLAADGQTQNFEGVSWQATSGTADQPPLGLEGFNAVETTTRVNLRLRHGVAVSRQGQGDAARLTLRFPRGLVHQNEAGIFGTEVRIIVSRRRPDGTWQNVRVLDIAEKQTAAFEWQLLVPLEPVADGQYQPAVRLLRETPDAASAAVRDEVELLAVTWLRWEKLNYPGVSLLGLRFDAESFSGRVPRLSVDLKGRLLRVPVNYNPLTRVSAGLWNGAFKSAWSNNPAWVLLDLLTDRDWGLGIDDSLIEIYDLHAIAAYCDGMVDDGRGGSEPRFRFDGVISRRQPAVQVIGQVCAAMRVHYFWSGGRLRFIQDRPDEPVMVLTNALVEDGAFVYTGSTLAAGFSHAMVSFTDPESDTGISVEAEIDPKFYARHGYKAREVALLGCTRRSQARRHARWLIATTAASLHGVSWHASLDHFAENPIRPGDIIRICDSQRIGSTASPGRIQTARGLVMRADIEPFAATRALLDYETVSSGWQEGLPVRVLPPRGSIPSRIWPLSRQWPEPPQPGGACLVRVDEGSPRGDDYRVIHLREIDRHRLEVNAIRHDPGLYDRVDNGFSLDPAPRDDRPVFAAPLPSALGLTLEQPRRLPHGGNGRDLHAGWQPPHDLRVALWRLEGFGPEGESRRGEVAKPPLVLRDLAVGEWRFRLKAVDWSGREGPAVETVFTIRADPGAAEPPQQAQITPGYGQIIITWDRSMLPRDALVEVLEYPSNGATIPTRITPTPGAVHILPGRTPGEEAYFRLRTRLGGDTLSSPGPWLVAAADALPEVPEAAVAPAMAARAVSGAVWSDAEAAAALGREPVANDLVTLYRGGESGNPWAETRRHDGTAWALPGPLLAGDVLAPSTVAASRLKVDPAQLEASGEGDLLHIRAVSADLITSGALQSADFAAGESGFRIDTAGSAEFNNALVRGVLEGSTIRSSLLVASTLTIPTEAGGRFLTLEKPRPLRYARRQVSGHVLTIGPMQVADDAASRHTGDRHNIILAADDPHGDNDAGDENRYFSRFWSRQPRIRLILTHRPTGTPWGEHITRGQVILTLKTASGRVLAASPAMVIDSQAAWQQTRQAAISSWLLPLQQGFTPGSVMTLSRSVHHEGRGQNRHYTNALTLTATLGCTFAAAAVSPANDGLMIEVNADFSQSLLTQKPVSRFYHAITLEGTTHD